MINTNFNIELEREGKTEEVKVVIQEVSPFKTTGIFSKNFCVESHNYNAGAIVEELCDLIVVEPKNLKEQIIECDNPLSVVVTLFTEFQDFCAAPRKYALKKVEEQCKEKSKNMEHDTSESDANRNKEHE